MAKKKNLLSQQKFERLQKYAKQRNVDYFVPATQRKKDLTSIPDSVSSELVTRLYRNVFLGRGRFGDIPAKCKELHFPALLLGCQEAIELGAEPSEIELGFAFGKKAFDSNLTSLSKKKNAYQRFVICCKALHVISTFRAYPTASSDWASHKIFVDNDILGNSAAEALTSVGRTYTDGSAKTYWGLVFGAVRSANPKSMACLRRLVRESLATPEYEILDDDYLGLMGDMLSIGTSEQLGPIQKKVRDGIRKRNRASASMDFANRILQFDVPDIWYASIFIYDKQMRNHVALSIDGGRIRDWEIVLNDLATRAPTAAFGAVRQSKSARLKVRWRPKGPADFPEFVKRLGKAHSFKWNLEDARYSASNRKIASAVKAWLEDSA